jgi:hypothetical protein
MPLRAVLHVEGIVFFRLKIGNKNLKSFGDW